MKLDNVIRILFNRDGNDAKHIVRREKDTTIEQRERLWRIKRHERAIIMIRDELHGLPCGESPVIEIERLGQPCAWDGVVDILKRMIVDHPDSDRNERQSEKNHPH